MSEVFATLEWYGQNPLMFASVMTILGLLIGSFLNVVIHRLPIMQQRELDAAIAEATGKPVRAEHDALTLSHPPSRCPACGHRISAIENIPVISYLVLRGKCRGCASHVSLRYPLVEILTGLMFLACAIQFGWSIESLAACFASAMLVAMAGIDADTRQLPDILTLPLLWAGLLASIFGDFAWPEHAIVGAVAGYMSLWGVYHLHRLVRRREGMGHGDFKLFAAIGAWTGWQALPLVALIAAVAGLVFGLATVLRRKKGQESALSMPFGPFLAIGGWLMLLWGDEMQYWLERLLFG